MNTIRTFTAALRRLLMGGLWLTLVCASSAQIRVIWDQSHELYGLVWNSLVITPSEMLLRACTNDNEPNEAFIVQGYTTAGAYLWTTQYQGPGNTDKITDAAAWGDDAVIVTGDSDYSWPATGVATMVINSAGAIQWIYRVDPPLYPTSRSYVAVVPGPNGYTLTSLGRLPNGEDLFCSKLDDEGVEEWSRVYASPSGAIGPVAVVADPSGVTIVGQARSAFFNFVKYSPAGVLLWDKTAGTGQPWERITNVLLDPVGNIYALATLITELGSANMVAWSYDPNGNLRWTSSLPPDNSNMLAAELALDPERQAVYALGGRPKSVYNIGSFYDATLYKYDMKTGAALWKAAVPLVAADVVDFKEARTDPWGNLYLIGGYATVYYNGETWALKDARCALYKYSPAGKLLWLNENATGWLAYEIEIDDAGHVYLSGRHTVKLHISAVLAEGDASGDGCVDDDDLIELILSFALDTLDADVTGDGRVDDDDLMLMLDYWLLGCGE